MKYRSPQHRKKVLEQVELMKKSRKKVDFEKFPIEEEIFFWKKNLNIGGEKISEKEEKELIDLLYKNESKKPKYKINFPNPFNAIVFFGWLVSTDDFEKDESSFYFKEINNITSNIIKESLNQIKKQYLEKMHVEKKYINDVWKKEENNVLESLRESLSSPLLIKEFKINHEIYKHKVDENGKVYPGKKPDKEIHNFVGDYILKSEEAIKKKKILKEEINKIEGIEEINQIFRGLESVNQEIYDRDDSFFKYTNNTIFAANKMNINLINKFAENRYFSKCFNLEESMKNNLRIINLLSKTRFSFFFDNFVAFVENPYKTTKEINFGNEEKTIYFQGKLFHFLNGNVDKEKLVVFENEINLEALDKKIKKIKEKINSIKSLASESYKHDEELDLKDCIEIILNISKDIDIDIDIVSLCFNQLAKKLDNNDHCGYDSYK